MAHPGADGRDHTLVIASLRRVENHGTVIES
jgi:hypothetical protein